MGAAGSSSRIPLRLSHALPQICLRPHSPGAAGAPERPWITGQNTVPLSLVPWLLLFLAGGPRAFEGAARFLSSSLGQTFPAAGALTPGKGNFHPARSPAARSTEPSRPGSTDLSFSLSGSRFLPRSERQSGLEAGVGELYTGPSSWQNGSCSVALGLGAENVPIFPAAAQGVQRDLAATEAAVAALSITRTMPRRAAQRSPPRLSLGLAGRTLHTV